MKIYVRTPAGIGLGIGLGIDVLLTGLVKETGGTITSVEIYMPIGGHLIVGYSIEPLPKGRGSTEILWVDPSDLRTNDGAAASQEALRTEVASVEASLRYEATYGPLGKDWP